MPRFFAEELMPNEQTATLTGDDAHHIAFSLRMACGDEITLSDGRGHDYRCRLTSITKERVTADILSCTPSLTESPVDICLYQAFPKGDKLELIIQKAVELGVSRIVPFFSAFCIKRPHADKWDKQHARLTRIAEEAAKQCGRGCVPQVLPPIDFSKAIRHAAQAEVKLFCYEGAGTQPLPACLPAKRPQSISVMIGSEGGFSESEAQAAAAGGLTPTGLGSRILRCETAPLFVLSSLSFLYELS